MLSKSPNSHVMDPPLAVEEDQGIDLLALAAKFVTEWRLGLSVFFVVALLGAVYVARLKSQYVATATILPQAGHADTESLFSMFSQQNSATVFTGLLKSRSVANDIIDRANLLRLYHTNSYAAARATLAGQSSFSVGADTILTISVKDANAQSAAMIADAYLEALDRLNLQMAQDQSRQLQRFFAEQLADERTDLFKAEDALEKTQKQTGLVLPETQAQIGLNAIAGVRSQIVNLQVQLAALLQSETDQNPQVQRLRSQIAQLQEQEGSLENGHTSPVGAAPPAGQLPSTNLDYLRAQREVTYHNNLVNSLSTQYETARLSADLNRSAFQIIDRAVVPERKSWPPRKEFYLVVLVFGVLAGTIAVVIKLLFRRILNDPVQRQSLRGIRTAFVRG